MFLTLSYHKDIKLIEFLQLNEKVCRPGVKTRTSGSICQRATNWAILRNSGRRLSLRKHLSIKIRFSNIHSLEDLRLIYFLYKFTFNVNTLIHNIPNVNTVRLYLRCILYYGESNYFSCIDHSLHGDLCLSRYFSISR